MAATQNRSTAPGVTPAVRPSWPAAVASVVLHGLIVLVVASLRIPPQRPTFLPAPRVIDLDLAEPPPPPVVPPPVLPPVAPQPPTATPPTARPVAAAAASATRPAHVLTATSGVGDPSPVAVVPVEPSRPDAGVPAIPPNLRATSLLAGARDLSMQMAGAQPTPEQQRQEIRNIALAPIIEGLHANDHIDAPGTARASAILTTRLAEEIASRINAPTLVPEVERAPTISLPRYNPTESAGERMAGSELDAVHANSFQSVGFGPGSPACSSYRALLVDLSFTDADAGPAAVGLLRGSGVASLDRAVMEVARELVAEAAPPGRTRWRFELADDAMMVPGRRCSSVGGWRPLAGGQLRVRFRRMHGR